RPATGKPPLPPLRSRGEPPRRRLPGGGGGPGESIRARGALAAARSDGGRLLDPEQVGDHGSPALKRVVLADVVVGGFRQAPPQVVVVKQTEHAVHERGVVLRNDGGEARCEAPQ